ncbi:MAG: FIST C-terminal domain-containing protein [Alphaproteobacteria bacterium]|nr:FIST C-terminal domain-containing protein [Alphaproteobacteria bacterium]
MTSYRAAAGSGDDWLSACDDCLSELGTLSPDANLGIVYVSASLAHALDLIAARLKEATGIDAWVGTGGVGVCARGAVGFPNGAISVLTASLPPGGFQLFDGLADQNADDMPERADAGRPARLAIVHGDPRQIKTPSMIERLGATTGAFLVGGLTSASGDGAMQIAGRPTEGGLSGVLMSGDIPVITGLTQGCTPIGPVRTITGTDGPWITTLERRPALESLKEDVGPVLARSLERITGFILAARPEAGLDQNDYLVRDLGGIDPLRGFVMVGDDLRPGDRLCFVKRDPEGAKADLRRLTADLKRRADGRPILGALYHSCIGRGRHLFGTEEAELAIIEEEFGPMPLAGFHTNGEIFRDRLYGYSAVLTLFLGGAPA